MNSLRKALLMAALCGATALTAQELHLTSPDGSHEVHFYQTAVADDVRELRYSIGYRGAEVITDARAGLEMDNEVWEKALGFRSLEQPERWAQATFTHGPLAELTQPVERALTLDLPNGLWVALTDADVDDWCLTKYAVSPTDTNTLRSVMYSPVDVVTYCATPWKVVMAADATRCAA